MVIIVFGLPGSGKSFFAKQLATVLEAEYINSDTIRSAYSRPNQYPPEEKNGVYDAMLHKMLSALHDHKNVLLDATFYKNKLRKRFATYVPDARTLHFIEVVAVESLIRERLLKRTNGSDDNFPVYQFIKSEWEEPQFPHLVLTSENGNVQDMLHRATTYLNQHIDPAARNLSPGSD